MTNRKSESRTATRDGMTIGRVASATNCSVETIRYYEKERLLPEVTRTEGGHRLYSLPLLERLVFIRRSRNLGFTLDQVRQLLLLVDGNRPTSCEHAKAITNEHLEDIRAKIADLEKLALTLQNLSDQCPGGSKHDCPIITSLQSD